MPGYHFKRTRQTLTPHTYGDTTNKIRNHLHLRLDVASKNRTERQSRRIVKCIAFRVGVLCIQQIHFRLRIKAQEIDREHFSNNCNRKQLIEIIAIGFFVL